MKYILKNISHFNFFEGLENYYTETVKLLETKNINQLKDDTTQLFLDANQYLIIHTNLSSDEILDLLVNEYGDRFFLFSREPNIDDEIERLKKLQNSLRLTIGYLSMVDTLFNDEKENMITTISEKKDFILSKLNSVFGNEYYSIQIILKYNGINYRDDESYELAEELSKRGYIICKDKYSIKHDDKVKLSVKGASYIERKLSKKNTKKTELDKKMDAVIEQLTKLGFGQEIIFNEIAELRELQYKLSKKSWSQLLKGKLIDLALDKLISVEAAKTVYEYLTSNNFKLLK